MIAWDEMTKAEINSRLRTMLAGLMTEVNMDKIDPKHAAELLGHLQAGLRARINLETENA